MLCKELPHISWFENNNPYTECHYLFHYIIIPNVKEETMTVKIWHGEFCYEKSLEQIVDEMTFPMTSTGRNDMIAYIRKADMSYIS